MTHIRACAAVIVLGLVLHPTPASSQRGQPAAPGPSASAEILKPSIDGVDDSFSTSATFLDLRYPAFGGAMLRIDIPITHLGLPTDTSSADSLLPPGRRSVGGHWTQISNPGVAVQWWAGRNRSMTQEIGIRIPLGVPDDGWAASDVGVFAELERLSAFVNDVIPVRYAADYLVDNGRGDSARLGVASEVWFPTADLSSNSVYLTYHLIGGFDRGPQGFRLGIVGGLFTDSQAGTSIGDRMANQIEAGAATTYGGMKTELGVRVWIDRERRELIPVVVRLKLEWGS